MTELHFQAIRLPFDLVNEKFDLTFALDKGTVDVFVPDSYISDMSDDMAKSEVLAIQRLLTLSRYVAVQVFWESKIALRVHASPTIFPLLAVLLTLENIAHRIAGSDDDEAEKQIDAARRLLFKQRLRADLFTDTQIVICADSRGRGTPPDLYDKGGRLISREDFEALIEELVSAQAAANVSTSKAVYWSSALATIVLELVENADTHGKTELSGVPIGKNGIRGLVLKRIKFERTMRKGTDKEIVKFDAFELSVFDSGPGFYGSFMGQSIEESVALEKEWRVVHACLERHFEPGLISSRPAHRGMGLYEVLRALHQLNGAIEVRTGRIFGYRTFMEGEIKFMMEPSTSPSRPGMPKPQLLDAERRVVTVPTKHELLVGSSVRVIVPLQ